MSPDAEAELSRRCVESISNMGNSPTVVVDADDCSDETITNVAAQLQQKGWQVEVLPADGDDPAQLVISPPPAARTAAPPKPAPEPAVRQKTFAEQMAEDNLREALEYERQQQRGDTAQVTFTASKMTIVWAVVAIAVIGVFAVGWFLYVSPRRQLDQLAKDTCDDVDGAIMLTAISTLSSSINKAERLGFTGRELGDRMREHCPSIVRQIDEFASRF
jgi:hypothetical protein